MCEQVDCTDCTLCGHPFDPHSLIATTGDPLDGGIMLCPETGCECFSTWGTAIRGGKSDPPKRIPDRFEVAQLREVIQSPAKAKLIPKWWAVPEDEG